MPICNYILLLEQTDWQVISY